MAKFTQVDDRGRIFLIEDLLPPEQCAELLETDWQNLPWHPGLKQESWPRRWINGDDPTSQKLAQYINNQLPTINSALGTDFQRCGGQFWIDQPGFTVRLHTDGHLPNSMQIYWIMPGPEYGTGFYRYKSIDSLFYQFQSLPNSGYIMLNHADPDGSQPLQWHAMVNPVPEGFIRVSGYWQFQR